LLALGIWRPITHDITPFITKSGPDVELTQASVIVRGAINSSYKNMLSVDRRMDIYELYFSISQHLK
jgi:hypothetical protein